jgi:hypothetical protein
MRASYRFGVEWIALNDDPADNGLENVTGLISVCLLADLFGKSAEAVAHDVRRYRAKNPR